MHAATAGHPSKDGGNQYMSGICHLSRCPQLPQVFYYIVMALFGTMKGIVQLNLGAISTFQVGVVGAWLGT